MGSGPPDSNQDDVRPLEAVLARYRRPPVVYQPDWSQRPHPTAFERLRKAGKRMEELKKPLPGSIRRAVYDVLAYNTGQTELDIWVATSDLSNVQIYRALAALQELGLVECFHSNGVKLWCLVGASQHNDPTTHPPDTSAPHAPGLID